MRFVLASRFCGRGAGGEILVPAQMQTPSLICPLMQSNFERTLNFKLEKMHVPLTIAPHLKIKSEVEL
jgi:hypothetical protein